MSKIISSLIKHHIIIATDDDRKVSIGVYVIYSL